MNRNYPVVNALSIWEAIPHKGLYSKVYTSRRTYKLSSGTIVDPTPESPLIAYAKNYKKNKKDFSLFIYSDSKDEKSIEDFMDKAVKNITSSDISEALVIATTGGFKYTNDTYKGDK